MATSEGLMADAPAFKQKIIDGKKRFWMIWCSDKTPPTFLHLTLSSVQRETERLAKKSPGDKFFVLEAVAAAQQDGEKLNWEIIGGGPMVQPELEASHGSGGAGKSTRGDIQRNPKRLQKSRRNGGADKFLDRVPLAFEKVGVGNV